MPLLLADFIYSRDCKLNLRKKVDTTSRHPMVHQIEPSLKDCNKKRAAISCNAYFGAPSGTRTQDPLIKSQYRATIQRSNYRFTVSLR